MIELQLAQNLLSKVFHDFSGSVSAIGNGVEFLGVEDETMRRKALALVKNGSEHIVGKLEFFRKAYGTTHNKGEADLDEVKSLCTVFLKDSKIDIDFQKNYHHQPEVFICINTGKLILCLVSIAADVLIYGGIITVQIIKTNDNKKLIVTASGTKIKVDKDKNNILSGNFLGYKLSPTNAHNYYTAQIIKELNGTIVINSADDKVEYIIE